MDKLTKRLNKLMTETLTHHDLLRKVANGLWDLGVCHAYESQWMSRKGVATANSKESVTFVCPCGKRGEDLTMGYLTVIFCDDYVGGVHVQVLFPNEPLKVVMPLFDLPNW